jgi:aquaporin rerated protein, other eukaryote
MSKASKTSRPGLFSTLRDDILAAGFEFVGTTFWLLLGLGGIQTAYNLSGDRFSIGHNFYVAASMGLSLMAAAWIFFRATGGLFNPNVSLALVLVGAIGPVRFVLYSIAQFLGAIAAAGLVRGLLPGSLDVEYVYVPKPPSERLLTFHLVPTCRLTLAAFEVFSSRCSSPPL